VKRIPEPVPELAVGGDTCACFLRLRQGSSSEAESLRCHFVRARAYSIADTEADANTDVDLVAEADASRLGSGREVVRRFVPAVGSGDSACRYCFSGDGGWVETRRWGGRNHAGDWEMSYRRVGSVGTRPPGSMVVGLRSYLGPRYR